jgi:hypothetical protein
MLSVLVAEFRRYRQWADDALSQVDDLSFFKRPAPHVNPIAVIVKHVGGNLRSRWTDFLTTDGEKPDRNRDGEFLLTDDDSRERLKDAWREGWARVWTTLEGLADSDLDCTVTIRGEPHTVLQAALRSLNHTAYHTGQILYLVRLHCPDSRWLTVKPGESRAQAGNYLQAPGGR